MIRDQLLARSFERDCERLRPLGEAFVLRRFGGSLNRADAEDAVSEVLIRLHRRMAEGRPPVNLRATFFTSVRNAAIDQLRSRAAKPTVALEAAMNAPADSAIPSEHAESHDDAVRLQEALRRMRGNYRETIVLRFGLGMTVPEIARHMDISLPAAKKLVLRATRQVKERLESIEGAEFCPEMREKARQSLFEKHASGLANESEAEILRTHFEHCGSCKSFLSRLHGTLHEFGAVALFAATTDRLVGKLGFLDHMSSWIADVSAAAQVGGGRLRMAGFKLSNTFQPGDAGAAGALAGTGQKIAAVCGVATTTTCLATGIVGPGIGGMTSPSAPESHKAPSVPVREASLPLESVSPQRSSALASAVKETRPPKPQSLQSSATKHKAESDQVKSRSSQVQPEFGFESSSSPPPPPTSSEFDAPVGSSSGAAATSSSRSSTSSSPPASSEFGF